MNILLYTSSILILPSRYQTHHIHIIFKSPTITNFDYHSKICQPPTNFLYITTKNHKLHKYTSLFENFNNLILLHYYQLFLENHNYKYFYYIFILCILPIPPQLIITLSLYHLFNFQSYLTPLYYIPQSSYIHKTLKFILNLCIPNI